jgi:hypothetical protein
MRQALLAAAFAGGLSVASCVIPSFEVEPAPTSRAGNGNSGTTGGGKSGNATGGKSTGATSNGGTDTGATDSVGGTDNPPSGSGAGAGGAGSGVAGPVHVGSSIFSDSASGDNHASAALTDATFAKPTGTAVGDFMLVFFGSDHTLRNLDTGELPTGWKLLDQHGEQGEDGQGTYLVYRTVDGTEPDPIVFPGINDAVYSNGVQGLLTVYRGVDTQNPINAYETVLVETGSEASKDVITPTPAITTDVDGCLLLAGLSPDSQIDAPIVTTWPEGFDEHQVSVKNPKAPYPLGWANIYAAERHSPQAGTLPASSFEWSMTYGGTTYYGALTFIVALAPAAAPSN